MGVDGDLTSIVREIVQFLESLYDIELPSKIENARINLLQKSKTKLSTIASNSSRVSTSPEPYLDMNAGKGFLLFTKKKNQDIEIEEYVGVEEQPDVSEVSSHQDYYETFQEINNSGNEINDGIPECEKGRDSWEKFKSRDEEMENKLREIYRTFTAAKTISKAHKCGPLYHKVERKPFGFVRGNTRHCWVGLVGSHLLIHGSEDDKQPPEIVSIRGYSARPAANSISKDSDRGKSAFEIFCPGNKTLQFVAKDPKEMEEWLEVINRTCPIVRQDGAKGSEEKKMAEERPEERLSAEEKYQDVGDPVSKMKSSPVLSTGEENRENEIERVDTTRNSIISLSSPPILPVRMSPRRLPSLPNEEIPVTSYEPLSNGYEEDDIYHKIEDFRESGRSYENVKKSKSNKKFLKSRKKKRKEEMAQVATYDDVGGRNETRKEKENNETYDDVRSSIDIKKACNLININSITMRRNGRESSDDMKRNKDQALDNYHDVSQSPSSKLIRSRGKTKNGESKRTKTLKNSTESEKNSSGCEKSPTKSPHKRSFLDRVRRKDSPRKDEKKSSKECCDDKKYENKGGKTINSQESPVISEAQSANDSNLNLPTYDDVSGAWNDSTVPQTENSRTTDISIQTDDTSNYNCPPPPRPIYSEPPSPILVSSVKNIEDSSLNEIYDDIGDYRENDKNLAPSNGNETGPENNENVNGKTEINRKLFEDEKKNSFECEHYQTPRAVRVDLSAALQREEELYDDIAILEDFRARQRDSTSTSGTPKKSSHLSIADVTEKSINPTKRSWNRFGSVKKISSRDSLSPRNGSPADDQDDTGVDNASPAAEKQEAIKMNKLQKFINKMEYTLGKQPSGKSTDF